VQETAGVRQVSLGRAWAVYTALRLAVFAGTAAALFLLLRLNGLLLLLVALLLSSIASLFLLRPQRDRFVRAQEQRILARREEKAQLRERLDDDAG
jgi:hypothetical protein